MTTTITKSPIIKQGVNFPKYEIIEDPKQIIVSQKKEPSLYEIVSRLLKSGKFYIKIAYYFIKLITVLKMDNSNTTKYANRSFWSTVVSIIVAILGIFQLDLESIGLTQEVLITFLVSASSLIYGIWNSRQVGKLAKDDE